jgi:hypothetical protein
MVDPAAPDGTLLVLGAAALPAGAAAAARIILVAPDPDLAAALERQAAADPRTTVVAAGLEERSGQAEHVAYNLDALSGTARPAGLQALYPGLRAVARHVVPVLSASDLMARLGPLPPPVRLVIRLPGSEAAVIDGLAGGIGLGAFDRIDLRCAAEPLHEGAAPFHALADRIRAEGWMLAEENRDDPDWPVAVFHRDPAVTALHDLRRRLAAAEAAHATALHDADSRLAAAEAAHATALHDADSRLAAAESALRDADARIAALHDEHASARQALTTERAERAAEIARLSAKLGQRDGALQEAEGRAGTLARELAAAQAELAETRSRIAGLTAARDDLAGQCAASQADLAAARAGLQNAEARAADLSAAHRDAAAAADTARRDLAMALRLQAAATADIADLRDRHAEVVAERDRMADLLLRLTPRLREAAQVMQGLAAGPAEPPAVEAPPKRRRGDKKAGRR